MLLRTTGSVGYFFFQCTHLLCNSGIQKNFFLTISGIIWSFLFLFSKCLYHISIKMELWAVKSLRYGSELSSVQWNHQRKSVAAPGSANKKPLEIKGSAKQQVKPVILCQHRISFFLPLGSTKMKECSQQICISVFKLSTLGILICGRVFCK